MPAQKGMPAGILCVGLLLLTGVAHAATTNPGGSGYLDTIAGNFSSATSGWMTTAQGYAQHIFASLAALDLGWWGIKNVLKKNDLADFIGGATLKISSIFFFYTIVSYAPTWMPLITSSFMQMGQGIGGGGAAATTPSGIMSEAFSVISTLWTTVQAQSSWDHLASNLLFAMVAVITSVFGLIGFGLVALQLFMTQVELNLVGGAGLVMLGFTGSGMTSSFGEKYIGYMISIGIKLLVIYAIVGLGQNVINSEIAYINAWTSDTPPLDLLSVGATMLIYGVIGMQVPGMAGSLMNGSPNMSLGNVAGGAAAIAGGAMAAGGAALAGYAGATKSLDRMAEMVGAGVGAAGGSAGGIGGSDSLGALSSMTGEGASASAGSGMAPSTASVPASGSADALSAGTQSGSGSSGSSGPDGSAADRNSNWQTMGDQLGKLAGTKDDIARHEGSTGSGIQIRLNHAE